MAAAIGVLGIQRETSGAPSLQWIKQSGTTGYDFWTDIVWSGPDHLFVAGESRGDFDGAGPGGHQGHFDALLAKYDVSGTRLWSRQFGTAGYDYANTATLDASGSIYVTGAVSGDFDLAGAGIYAGATDAFLAKFTPAGVLDWVRQSGTSGDDAGSDVAVDGSGNIYLSGNATGDLDGAGPGIHAGLNDVFLAKYDPTGGLLWRRQLGTSGYDSGNSLVFDGVGNVVMAGTTHGDLDGAGPGAYFGGGEAFLTKFDPTGNLLWTRQLGPQVSTGENGGTLDIAQDDGGNLYLTGFVYGDLDGQGPGIASGQSDVFLAKYDANGSLLWTRQLGSPDYDGGHSVAADGLGNVYVYGSTSGDIDGAGPGTNLNPGSGDMFVAKYNAGGSLQWLRQLGTNDYDSAGGISIDRLGRIYLAGVASGDLDGAGPGSYAGVGDAVLLKFVDSDAVPGPGDFDGDGDVDGNDFLRWQRGLSSNPMTNGDLALWRSNFGVDGAEAAGSAAPESSSLAVALAALPILRRRFR